MVLVVDLENEFGEVFIFLAYVLFFVLLQRKLNFMQHFSMAIFQGKGLNTFSFHVFMLLFQ
jgi:hypothetical protein